MRLQHTAASPGEEGEVLLMGITRLPVVVLGAGPVGLAAAAHLLERGCDTVVLEAADEVGASPRDWGHVRLFSPWRYNVDEAAVRLLTATGWTPPPPDDLPTGDELFGRYLRPLAGVPSIRERLRLDRRVVAIARHGVDKVRTAQRSEVPLLVRTTSRSGVGDEVPARAVIDATGTWWTPNPVGAAGIPALGELELRDRIQYGIPDVLGVHRNRYAGKTTVVVGAGHSAANSILALAALARSVPGTAIQWVTRGDSLTRVFGGGDADTLPARGRLGAELRALTESGTLSVARNVRIESLRSNGATLDVLGTQAGEPLLITGIHEIIASTGQRPDHSIARELRLSLDPALECVSALAPLIDPTTHSCGSVRPHGARELAHPEPDVYIIGSKSYGRAPTFLLAIGYEQARSVAAMIAGDVDAASRVALELAETGVCSIQVEEAAGACCATANASCC